MKLIPLLIMSLFAQALLFAAAPPKRPSKAEMQKLMAQMHPGPEHQHLGRYEGEWELSITTGRGSMGKSTGSAKASMILGNRFMDIRYQAQGPSGAFEGTFTLGFDRRHKHYVLIAMDTSGTYFVTSKGTLDSTTGRLKLYGKDDDPFMESMGYTKEFAHSIDLNKNNQFSIEVLYIDTRTEERTENAGMTFQITRKG